MSIVPINAGEVSGLIPIAVEDVFTPTLGQTVFTLSSTPLSADAFALYLNGQLRLRGTDYTQVGTTLTWLDPGGLTLLTTDELIARYNDTAGGLLVESVFGRTGAVVATASDYDASEVDNDSGVVGATVKDALDQLDSDISTEDTWDDDGTDVTPANAGRNVDIGTGGLKDNDATVALPLADVSNTGLDASITATSVLGAINENKIKETFVSKAFGDSPYSAVAGDNAISVNTAGGAVSIVLPAAASNIGVRIRISKVTSDANIVTIDTTGGDTIGFQASWDLSHQGDSVTAISDGVSEWCLFTERHASGSKFFSIEPDTNLGNHRVQNIGATGNFRFGFQIPGDFLSIIKLVMIASPTAGAAGSGKDIDLSSDYATIGEAHNTHTETDTATTYDFTGDADKLVELDISPVFSSIAALDVCGVNVDHNSIGGGINYFGIELEYIKKS